MLTLKNKKTLFLSAASTYIILGLAHLTAHFFVINRLKNAWVYGVMEMTYLDVFFSRRNLVEFLKGFSMSMGFFMIAYGGLNLLTYFLFEEQLLPQKPFHGFNALVSFIIAALSALYLLWIPVVVFLIVGLVFLMLFIF